MQSTASAARPLSGEGSSPAGQIGFEDADGHQPDRFAGQVKRCGRPAGRRGGTRQDGPGPLQVAEKGVDAAGLSHHGHCRHEQPRWPACGALRAAFPYIYQYCTKHVHMICCRQYTQWEKFRESPVPCQA